MNRLLLTLSLAMSLNAPWAHGKTSCIPSAGLDGDRYREHVLVIDPDGSALLPTISNENGSYKITLEKMKGEDTSRIDGAALGRCGLYDYLNEMFMSIWKNKPKKIMIYIHGGLNDIKGATEKGAEMADRFKDNNGGYSEIYPICICWSSNVDTYFSHLGEIRNGLHVSPLEGYSTAPITFAADLATACVRAPVTWLKEFGNDLYAAKPAVQQRYRHTLDRYQVLYAKHEIDPKHSIAVSRAEDGREKRFDALAGDVGLWFLTLPEKMTTSVVLDSLGPQAWHVMLRRTRTMFERESSFVPSLEDTERFAAANEQTLKNKTLSKFRSEVLESSRKGALDIFLSDAQQYLALADNQSSPKSGDGRSQPFKLTLVGHSMGAIIANEMLQHVVSSEMIEIAANGKSTNPILFDHVVYMAAACTIRDFKRDALPYLELHPTVNFFNLSLHDNAERSEKNTTFLCDLTPRGSLLVWIDSFLDDPPSEDDRTLGRWENAVLMTDDLPSSVCKQISLKSFGRDRLAEDHRNSNPPLDYTDSGIQYPGSDPVKQPGFKYILEPTTHGSFSRFNKPEDPRNPNFGFWKKKFRKPEQTKDSPSPAPVPGTRPQNH